MSDALLRELNVALDNLFVVQEKNGWGYFVEKRQELHATKVWAYLIKNEIVTLDGK